MKEEETDLLLEIVWRNGNIIFALDMGYCPKVNALTLIVSKFNFIQLKNLVLASAEETMQTK